MSGIDLIESLASIIYHLMKNLSSKNDVGHLSSTNGLPEATVCYIRVQVPGLNERLGLR